MHCRDGGPFIRYYSHPSSFYLSKFNIEEDEWINADQLIISLYYFPSSFYSSFVVHYSQTRNDLGTTSRSHGGNETRKMESITNHRQEQNDDHLDTKKNCWYNSFLPVDTFASVIINEQLLMRWLLKDMMQKEEGLIAAPAVTVSITRIS